MVLNSYFILTRKETTTSILPTMVLTCAWRGISILHLHVPIQKVCHSKMLRNFVVKTGVMSVKHVIKIPKSQLTSLNPDCNTAMKRAYQNFAQV